MCDALLRLAIHRGFVFEQLANAGAFKPEARILLGDDEVHLIEAHRSKDKKDVSSSG